jgi:uncharacterized membrane protein YhaH (DUF805 family)
MNPFSIIVSSSGRMARQPFVVGAFLVYIAAIASQALLSAPVMAEAGVWAFALAQVVLIWVWYALHARRLHDAECRTGGAAAIAVIWALAAILYVLVMAVIYQSAGSVTSGDGGSTIVAWIAFLYLVAIFNGTSDFGPLGLLIAALIIGAFMPFLIALGFSIWAASQPSVPATPPAAA